MEKQELYLVYLKGKDDSIYLAHKSFIDWARSVRRIPPEGISIPPEIVEIQMSIGEYGGDVRDLEKIQSSSCEPDMDILNNVESSCGSSRRKDIYEYIFNNKETIEIVEEIDGWNIM